jgi:genome maintenance exonuclease 1
MAGRVDCIGEYDGVLSVIDFKTATKTKKEEWIQNYFEQATAYAIMYEELYGEPIKQIVIMITTSEGEIQIFKKKTKDYISPLNETIKNFWKSNQMNTIQEIIKENRK